MSQSASAGIQSQNIPDDLSTHRRVQKIVRGTGLSLLIVSALTWVAQYAWNAYEKSWPTTLGVVVACEWDSMLEVYTPIVYYTYLVNDINYIGRYRDELDRLRCAEGASVTAHYNPLSAGQSYLHTEINPLILLINRNCLAPLSVVLILLSFVPQR